MSRPGTIPRRDCPILDDELDVLFGGLTGPLALAVSGGADSMALMHLVARWRARATAISWRMDHAAGDTPPHAEHASVPIARPPWLADVTDADQLQARGGPPPIVVVTVDHGLRPDSSADAAFVAIEAAKLGLPCAILRWEGIKPETGIQEAARHARRALLIGAVEAERAWVDHLLVRGGRSYSMLGRSIVMAHHAGDQAETFLMRLARGSGLDGLSAIRSRDLATASDGSSAMILRPMLAVPAERLKATLVSAGLPWRDDPSNASEKFERIRVRKALAGLEDLGVGPMEIAASAARLGSTRQGYAALLNDGPARSVVWHDGLMAEMPMSRWAPDVTLRLVQGVLLAMGGEAMPARLSQIEELLAKFTAQTDATLGGCRITTDGESRLRIWRETGRGLPTLDLARGERKPWDGGRFTVAMSVDAAAQTRPEAPVTVSALGAADWAGLKRALPELTDLRLPAGAVAGLPAFRRNGLLLAVPTLERIVATRAKPGSVLAQSLRHQLGPEVVPFSADFTGASRRDMPVSFRPET